MEPGKVSFTRGRSSFAWCSRVSHTPAGQLEELSAIANHHPEAASALVYLDAGFPTRCTIPRWATTTWTLLTLERQLASLLPDAAPPQSVAEQLKAIAAELPVFQSNLKDEAAMQAILPPPPPSAVAPCEPKPLTPSEAIIRCEEKFNSIPLPTLAIFAVPHNVQSLVPDGNAGKLKQAEALDLERTTRISDSFATKSSKRDGAAFSPCRPLRVSVERSGIAVGHTEFSRRTPVAASRRTLIASTARLRCRPRYRHASLNRAAIAG